jgi:hypothetical protein
MKRLVRQPWTMALVTLCLAAGPGLPADGKKGPPNPKPQTDFGPAPVQPGPVSLTISTEQVICRQGDRVKVRALLLNEGKKPVTLVRPGDGSDCGWRTPVVGWSVRRVLPVDAPARVTARLVLPQGRRLCGNINALKASEVFTLPPGQFKRMDGWIGPPDFPEPGTYRIVLLYKNEPGRRWLGIPLGEHDAKAMKQVQASHPCYLASNELLITVLKKK